MLSNGADWTILQNLSISCKTLWALIMWSFTFYINFTANESKECQGTTHNVYCCNCLIPVATAWRVLSSKPWTIGQQDHQPIMPPHWLLLLLLMRYVNNPILGIKSESCDCELSGTNLATCITIGFIIFTREYWNIVPIDTERWLIIISCAVAEIITEWTHTKRNTLC